MRNIVDYQDFSVSIYKFLKEDSHLSDEEILIILAELNHLVDVQKNIVSKLR